MKSIEQIRRAEFETLVVSLLVMGSSICVSHAQAEEPAKTSLSSSSAKFVQDGAFRVALPPKVFTTRCHNWLLYYCDEISKLQIHPAEAVGYYNEAVSLHRKGFLNNANAFYRKAIEGDSDFSEPWANLGTIYLVQKSPDKAKACFEQSLGCRNGQNWMTLRYLASISESEGDDARAADYWQRTLAVAEANAPDGIYTLFLKEYIQFLRKTHRDVEVIVYEEKLKKYSTSHEGFRL